MPRLLCFKRLLDWRCSLGFWEQGWEGCGGPHLHAGCAGATALAKLPVHTSSRVPVCDCVYVFFFNRERRIRPMGGTYALRLVVQGSLCFPQERLELGSVFTHVGGLAVPNLVCAALDRVV
jgi:hypothetical protein